MAPAIEVKNLKKNFGNLAVLKDINFQVKKGTITALLGPNGAGKTTTVKILSTLLLPDSGAAKIGGANVIHDADTVKSKIGLTGQFAAVDDYLTAEENLMMIGRLYRMDTDNVQKRTKKLLEQFDLTEAAKRPVKTYSGGMKRRVDLAMSLIASPQVLFLDEPTTGLDPRSRMTLWEIIKELVDNGTTILLTTQHMDEADYLADRIVVIDEGEVIASGTPNQLKSKVGADRVELVFSKKKGFSEAGKIIKADLQVDEKRRSISVATDGGVKELNRILDNLAEKKIEVESVALRRPSLDDVFLSLTGRKATKNSNGKNEKR